MSTAISGLTSQSDSFGNISDNIANSQTVGFKRVDTSFVDYLTTSTSAVNDPGAVVARPDYQDTVQGTISQSDNPLALAISGQGFFAVSEANGRSSSQVTFNQLTFYSRAGDFQMDSSGYLVNSAGEYLNGWSVDPVTGAVNRNALGPIQVTQTLYNPVPTTQVTLAANLPATPATGTTTSSQVAVYDSLGKQHIITLDWTQNAANDWTVSVNSGDDVSSAARGTAEVQFGSVSGNGVAEGTPGKLRNGTGSVTTSSYGAGNPATITFTSDFGLGAQTIQLNLGTYGEANGVTQFAGTTYSLRSLTQNGIPPGSFNGLSTQTNGDIVANYDNGQARVIAQVPIVTFGNAGALQRQNGQAFTTTESSGNPAADAAGTNGAGNLVTSSIESSNVDIATEFSKLIVAQQAYSANSKVVTTANQLLQTTIDMLR
jgi:flagellar hook protein FlgE